MKKKRMSEANKFYEWKSFSQVLFFLFFWKNF